MKDLPVHIGVLSIELLIPQSQSLKSKRRVLKSLKDRIRAGFNVSVAEIDGHDKWQRARLGVCMINNDKDLIQKVFQGILDLAGSVHEAEVADQTIEFV